MLQRRVGGSKVRRLGVEAPSSLRGVLDRAPCLQTRCRGSATLRLPSSAAHPERLRPAAAAIVAGLEWGTEISSGRLIRSGPNRLADWGSRWSGGCQWLSSLRNRAWGGGYARATTARGQFQGTALLDRFGA